MELALLFYLAGVVGGVQLLLGLVVGVGGFALLVSTIVTVAEGRFDRWPRGLFRKLVLSWIAMAITCALIPDKKTIYTMAAAYGVQTAAENPNVQRMAGKSLQLLEGKLDEYLKDGKKVE